MAGWGKVVAGAVLGVVGTVYATNEEFRKQLPQAARDLPVTVRNRFKEAVSAAREASTSRREEILRDLQEHGAHAARPAQPEPEAAAVATPAEPVPAEPTPARPVARTTPPRTMTPAEPAKPSDVDETRPLPRIEED